ncbi:DUF4097 family beta strand repeat-containing protein [soil metagenome]
MDRWIVDEPQVLELGAVRSLRIRVVAGDVDVVGTDGPARLEVHDIEGPPLQVTLSGGELVITYDDLAWPSLLSWIERRHLRRVSLSVAVPRLCPVELGVVSASAIVSGIAGDTSVRSVSGTVALDGVRAPVSANTVSGNVETRSLHGPLRFKTVSGDLTVVDGASEVLRARTVSGDITIDLDVCAGGAVDLDSVSGDVIVRLPETVGLDVDLASTSGHLDCAFGGLTEVAKPGRRRLQGRVGDGTGRLHGRTVSGDIALLRRSGP